MMSGVDLHIHTVYSDGTDTPETLINNLRKFNIHTFAVSDHDTVDGCRAFLSLAAENMRMICSVEFSCKTSFKKCHILGHGIDINHPAIIEAVNTGKKLRDDKLYTRLEHLKSRHGIVFSDSDIDSLKANNSVGKPHIARILVREKYADSINDAINKFLTFREINDKLDSQFAIDAIIAGGGIPIWAHPLGGEGEKRLANDEFERQLSLLVNSGIQGIECYYSRYCKDKIDFLKKAAAEYSLCISGGSDYHGSNKDINLGQLSCDGTTASITDLTVLNLL